MNERIGSGSGSATELTDAMHDVQSDLAHLLTQDSRLKNDAQVRKRRVEDRSSENSLPLQREPKEKDAHELKLPSVI